MTGVLSILFTICGIINTECLKYKRKEDRKRYVYILDSKLS